MDEKCGTCRFYRTNDSEGCRQAAGKETANCCRFPPVYAVGNDFEDDDVDHPGVWWQPMVIFDEWCGEYKAYGA